MKRLSVIPLLAAALLLWGTATAWACTPVRGPAVVASFDPSTFAESITVDQTGDLLVSLTRWGETDNSGEVWCLGPCGRRTLLATINVGPAGLLTGIACDTMGRVYVVACTNSDAPLPGVYRIGAAGRVTRVMTLPAESFPNGIAIHDGFIYVSDSFGGAIWRAPLGCSCSPLKLWLSDPNLLPTTFLGVNGIAFWRNTLFMAVSDSGCIFQVDVRRNGSAGALQTVVSAPALRTADGIAFDAQGGLWITTNSAAGATAGPSGGLFRLSPAGVLTTIATNPGWLDYPTMPVFGTTKASSRTLYVANGSFEIGTPNVISLDARVAGPPLN
jgi:sugar lactone lactonase YvrE